MGVNVHKDEKNLSPLQLEFLQCGPHSLFQAYELVKMRTEYNRIMKQGEI
jgi:hypothetical protein